MKKPKFKVGDRIYLVKELPKGWWEGCIEQFKKGVKVIKLHRCSSISDKCSQCTYSYDLENDNKSTGFCRVEEHFVLLDNNHIFVR